jgi:predicted transcriptional regulator
MVHEHSDRFLSAFSRIEQHLRKITRSSKQDTFSTLLTRAVSQASIKGFSDDLREFADLRNAIVHERGGGYVIAEPHQETVDRLEQIEKFISQPPTIESLGTIPVVTCSPSDPIGKAAKAMFEGKFSQLPVYHHEKCIGLLTSETIARWIAAKFQPNLDILEEAPVEQVLLYGEEDSVYQFISRKTPIADVVALFDRTAHGGKSLDAVIITHSGKPDQQPLHILTVYDLPRLYRKAGLTSD